MRRSTRATSRDATVAGIAIRWEESGSGTPLVLIHGIPTSPRLWRHVVPRIRGARCLAWEMVGYGSSIGEGRGRDISMGRQADYLVQWLDHLGIQRAVLAGHDLGGGVAHIAAVRHPQRCSGLFLTNSIGYDSWPIPSVATMQKMHALVRRMPKPAFRAVLRMFMLRGHDSLKSAREAFKTHWPSYNRGGGAAAFAMQIRALDSADTKQASLALRALSIPARIAWGASDRFQKIKYGERFAEDLRAPLRRLEGARHFTPEDRPVEISEELNQLVAEAA
jgi:pimeloyl-ACP methyl ester carboxylesterase